MRENRMYLQNGMSILSASNRIESDSRFHPDHHERTAGLSLFGKLKNSDLQSFSTFSIRARNNWNFAWKSAQWELRAPGEGVL